MISSEPPRIFKTQQICIPDYGYNFVNKIPLLITLSRNIDFTDTSHLPTRTSRDIFEAFWRIYILYFKRGFKITTVHADG